jgi:thioesterase domain-containing protein
VLSNTDSPNKAGSGPAGEASGVSSEFTPLVLIQKGRSALPFFCVHGAGGNVLNFRDIARRLGTDQTFYGLQAQGVDGSAALTTIEEMAALYLPEVLRAQPKGPFLLGGYSGGGVVAYEMAQRLHRSGHEVGLLVLLDTFCAGLKPLPTSMKHHLNRFMQEGPKYLGRRAKAKLTRRVDEISNVLKIRFYMSQNQPLPFELRDLQLARAFLEAADRYAPEPYPGPVTLYRASEVSPTFRHAGPKLGWDDLTPQMKVVEVPGDHDTLVYEPNVNVMTSHLGNALRQANAGR